VIRSSGKWKAQNETRRPRRHSGLPTIPEERTLSYLPWGGGGGAVVKGREPENRMWPFRGRVPGEDGGSGPG